MNCAMVLRVSRWIVAAAPGKHGTGVRRWTVGHSFTSKRPSTPLRARLRGRRSPKEKAAMQAVGARIRDTVLAPFTRPPFIVNPCDYFPAMTTLRNSTSLSPWPFSFRVKLLLWEVCWAVFCRWTPKPCNRWRLFWLRGFGTRITGRPFVHQRARIAVPWHVTLFDRACVGDRANLYSLGEITLKEGCIVAQEAYLCTGYHDLSLPGKPLITAPIVVEEDAFVGARAFVLMGLRIGRGAVVGACAVVAREVGPGKTVTGNPAREVRRHQE